MNIPANDAVLSLCKSKNSDSADTIQQRKEK